MQWRGDLQNVGQCVETPLCEGTQKIDCPQDANFVDSDGTWDVVMSTYTAPIVTTNLASWWLSVFSEIATKQPTVVITNMITLVKSVWNVMEAHKGRGKNIYRHIFLSKQIANSYTGLHEILRHYGLLYDIIVESCS